VNGTVKLTVIFAKKIENDSSAEIWKDFNYTELAKDQSSQACWLRHGV